MSASPLVLTAIAGFVLLLVAAAVADVRARLIPDWVPIGILALYPLYAWGAGADGWLAALGIALLVFAGGFALFSLGLAGGGDVKLLAAVSLWAGPALILPLLVVTGIAGGAVALFAMLLLLLMRGPRGVAGYGIPYGVAIAIGGGAVAHRLFLT